MKNVALALLLSNTGAMSTLFSDAQKATFCVVSKYFTTDADRSTCNPTTSAGQGAAATVDVSKDNARSYTTACGRRCLKSQLCLGFQATEPADDGTGGACSHFTQALYKDTWDADKTGKCMSGLSAVEDDTSGTPTYPTTNVISKTVKSEADCKTACIADPTCTAIQFVTAGTECKLLSKTGALTGNSAAGTKCVTRELHAAAVVLPRAALNTGTAKTMCYTKTDPDQASTTEDETGFALAFQKAAEDVIKAKKDDATAATWKKTIESSRTTNNEAVKLALNGNADILPLTQNSDDEFIKTWAMLLVDTFDKDSEKQKKFYADIKLETDANPLGSEFGTIYKALEGDALTKANTALETLCLKGKTDMYLTKTQEMLKATTDGKYYEMNLEDATAMCVKAMALMKAGYALMPFNAANTAAMKDINAAQQAYVKAQGAIGLHTAAEGKGPLSIFEYLTKRQDKIAGDAVTTKVRGVIMKALTALPKVADAAADLTTQKASIQTALEGWNKYAKPALGKQGYDCSQNDADPPVRITCADEKDADDKITKKGCCAAGIPYKETHTLADWLLGEVNPLAAKRVEVCVLQPVAADATPVTTYEPVQFVEILEKKYTIQCIEGAMKAAAGAAAVMGSIFMMQ